MTLQPGMLASLPQPPERPTRKCSDGSLGIDLASSPRDNSGRVSREHSRSKSLSISDLAEASHIPTADDQIQKKISALQRDIESSKSMLSSMKQSNGASNKLKEKISMSEAMLEALQTTAAMELLREHKGKLYVASFENIVDGLYSLEAVAKQLHFVKDTAEKDALLFRGCQLMWVSLKDGTLSYYSDKRYTVCKGSIPIGPTSRLIKAQLDSRLFILQGPTRAVLLGAASENDRDQWIACLNAANENLEVVDAKTVRKELRTRRSSTGHRKTEERLSDRAMKAGAVRTDFIPFAACFSQQLAVEFTSDRIILESGTLHDFCLASIFLGSEWDALVLVQNFHRFTTPLGFRTELEAAWRTAEKQRAADPRLVTTFRTNLVLVYKQWLSHATLLNDDSQLEEVRTLKAFCLTLVSEKHLAHEVGPAQGYKKGPLGVFSLAQVQEMSSETLAVQLATADIRLFSLCSPADFHANRWEHPVDTNLARVIKFSNTVTSLVGFTLLTTADKKARERLYSKWVSIAYRLHNMHCYNTALSVLAGLSQMAVSRLKLAEGLSSKQRTRHEKLTDLYSPARNFKNYRTLLPEMANQAAQPYLPVVAVLLKDLTFIEDGNTDTVENVSEYVDLSKTAALAPPAVDQGSVPGEKLNWYKCHLYSLQVYQMSLAHFMPTSTKANEDLIAGLLALSAPTDDELYEMSLRLSPIKVSLASLERSVTSLTSQVAILSDEVCELTKLKKDLRQLLLTSTDPAATIAECLALIDE